MFSNFILKKIKNNVKQNCYMIFYNKYSSDLLSSKCTQMNITGKTPTGKIAFENISYFL